MNLAAELLYTYRQKSVPHGSAGPDRQEERERDRDRGTERESERERRIRRKRGEQRQLLVEQAMKINTELERSTIEKGLPLPSRSG